jgi:hypothetical protein
MIMSTASKVLMALAFSVSASSSAWAQEPASGAGAFPPPAQGGVKSYRHASTAAEGFLRGWADLYRADGERNYNNAGAALILEYARRAHLDNRLKYAEVFWAKRALYEANQAAQRPPRREPVHSAANVKVVVPPQLVDPNQPGFLWPAGFNRPEFTQSIAQLTQLFAQRTPSNSGLGSESHWKIRNATLTLRAELAHQIKSIPGYEYTEAKRFLDKIMYTAEQPVQMQVAAN